MILGVRQVVERLSDALRAAGMKQDVSTDPAAPTPGPAFRVTVDRLNPANPAQGDDVNNIDSGRQYEATLSVIMTVETSGGKGSTETTIELAEWVEVLDGVCSKLTNGSDDSQYEWTDSRAFVGRGGLTKIGSTVLATYR